MLRIKIREFKLSDLEKVMEIEKISFPKSQAYPENYFKWHYQKYPEGFLVAENEGKILGYAIGRLKEIANGKVGEFISIAVKPEFRQKGIGRELANFLINHLKERGVKKIFLNVRIGNKTAISFYENLGFKILKKIENYYSNGEDAYLMQKET